MRIFDGKIYRDMTAEELTTLKSQSNLADIEERRRPYTSGEVLAMLIPQQINALPVDDNTALRMKDFYPEWTTGVTYEPGFKVRYKNKLWRVIQPHTSQVTWEPENVASLWETIDETHEGTLEDPIPYDGNMRLVSGKHYYQNRVIYLCTRDTGNPVDHALADLVGLYVEVV